MSKILGYVKWKQRHRKRHVYIFYHFKKYLQLNEIFQRVCIVLATFKAVRFSSLIDKSSCL